MDQLKDTISNLTIYDVKAYVRKAQNGKFPHFVSIKGYGCIWWTCVDNGSSNLTSSCHELYGDGSKGSRGH